jgi:hypothetical protein
VNESLRQRINILEDDKNNLKCDLTAVKQNSVKTDLSQFSTNRTYKINGTRMKLHQWLDDDDEYVIAGNWFEKHIGDIDAQDVDEFALRWRTSVYQHFGSKDIHVPEPTGLEVWLKPSEFIAHKFKGDCDKWATFLYYGLRYALVKKYGAEVSNRLYFALVGLNNKEGFNWGNHATLLWKHSDGKFYVIESAVKKGSDYISNALRMFGGKDYSLNFRYSRIVYMSNNKSNYYQVIL